MSRPDNRTRRRWMRVGGLIVGLCAGLWTVALPPADAAVDADGVTRVLTLLTVVGEEYRESFDATGTLARPLELEEARSFLAEARQRWEQLGDVPATAAVPRQLADLASAVDGKAGVDAVLAQAAALRAQITTATGIGENVYPPQPPSPQRGAAVFHEHCASCHGEGGDGHGSDAARLERKPANFTDPGFMRGETPYDHFYVITVGKRGAAMPAWGDVLTLQQRWDGLSYVWRLGHSETELAEGQGVYLSHCASCHGATGDGAGLYAPTLLTPVGDLTQPAHLAQRTDAELFTTVREGVPGTAMPAFRGLSDDERWKAVAFVRALSLGGPDGRGHTATGGEPAPPASQPTTVTNASAAPDALAETRRLLEAALGAYQANDPHALALVSDAYFRFEPLEKRLAVSAPDLTRQVESRFLELRGLVGKPDASAAAATVVAAIGSDLDAARAALEPHANRYALFIQSATIILREGFEIVLVIGALLAYVRKSGNAHMTRPIVGGTVAGIGLSLVTAYAFLRLFSGTSVGAAETLGGVTMLLAAVVLFWVSYWLVSKAEADKWQRFIQGKVKTALSTGSGLALAGAAFLAVYREGVETVLFYEALFGSASGAVGAAVGGLIAGAVALTVVCVLFVRFGMRIPIRPFFLGTGLLLYYMAIVFAGQGVAELQETGWIGVTLIGGVPRIDFLGLFPTLETLLAQGVLVMLLLYAIAVTLRRQRRVSATDVLLAEIRSLHQLALEIRTELSTRAVAEVPEPTGQRLETLIERVAALEGQLQLRLPRETGSKGASA